MKIHGSSFLVHATVVHMRLSTNISYSIQQARALRSGLDILVGTPGRVIDHMQRGNLDLSECDIVVLDEADEMLNMGFAEDVELLLDGVGSANELKTQCLLFSATTPSWVKSIGRNYQTNVLSIDATTDNQARTATTVRHVAIQVPPGAHSKKLILEDIIAVEISKDLKIGAEEKDEEIHDNPIAAAFAAKKKQGSNAMQQKIFGKTIVFTETKRDADDLVSGGVFKSLTAQVSMITQNCILVFKNYIHWVCHNLIDVLTELCSIQFCEGTPWRCRSKATRCHIERIPCWGI